MVITSKLGRTRKECVQPGRGWRKDYLSEPRSNENDSGKETEQEGKNINKAKEREERKLSLAAGLPTTKCQV